MKHVVNRLQHLSHFFPRRVCQPPRVLVQPNPVNITTGRKFSFRIPENTFIDKEDGNTRSLSLKLKLVTNGLPQKCWYNFNETAQSVSGLIYNEFIVGVKMPEITLEVTAMDSCGLTARTQLTLSLNRPSLHCFEIAFVFNTTKSYECELMPVDLFVQKVVQFFGFSAELDISVINYSKVGPSGKIFSVKIAVLQSRVGCSPCDFAKITSLTDRILRRSDRNVQVGFQRFMSPMFGVSDVNTRGIDACVPRPVTPTR